jgi:flagellar biosynthesis GTPase FlhF
MVCAMGRAMRDSRSAAYGRGVDQAPRVTDKQVVVLNGPAGVGKTTIAAAGRDGTRRRVRARR